jgi:DNA-binding transcriptional MerR regulator
MDELITIGRFANLTDLSPKFLRKLDERGLLSPAFVDPDTRYRYYVHAQVQAATLIRFCHQIHMPAAELRKLIAADDPDGLRPQLIRQRDRLARQLAEKEQLLALLDHELSRSIRPLAYDVALRDDAASLVAGATGACPRVHPHDPSALEDCIVAVGTRVLSWLEQRSIGSTGRALVLYLNDLEEGDELRFAVCFPVTPDPGIEKGERTRELASEPACFWLPAARLAVAVHEGPYDTVWNAHAALASWAQEQGFQAAGPTREVGLVSPMDTPDPRRWVTEVALPVNDR